MSTEVRNDKRELRAVARELNQRFKRYITRDHEEDVRKVIFELNLSFALAAALLYLISQTPG